MEAMKDFEAEEVLEKKEMEEKEVDDFEAEEEAALETVEEL